MKKTLLLLFTVVYHLSFYAQNNWINIKNNALNIGIFSHNPVIDIDGNDTISLAEAQNVDSLFLDGKNLNDIEELQLFPNLKSLTISNNAFTSLDVSFLNIDKLKAQGNAQLTSICVAAAQFPKTSNWLKDSQTVWDTNCGVKNIYFPDTAFKNELLRHTVYDTNHQMTVLDKNSDNEISYREALELGRIWMNDITGFMQGVFKPIDLSGIEHFKNLTNLICNSYKISNTNKINELRKLSMLSLLGNEIDSINLANHPSLCTISLASSKIKYVNLSNMKELEDVLVSFNDLSKLDLSSCTKLKTVDCRSNINLNSICIAPFQADSVDWTKDSSTAFASYCGSNIIDIKDNNFLNALLAYTPKIDTDNDNKISYEEALKVSVLDISNSGLLNLIDLSAFANLVSLNISGNALTQLDVSALEQLKELIANNNYLSAIIFFKSKTNKKEDVSSVGENNTLLSLDLSNNDLTNLDVSQLTALNNLNVSNNPQLSSVCVNQNQLNDKVNTWTKDANTSWSNQNCALISSVPTISNNTFIAAYPNPAENFIYGSEAVQGIYSVAGKLIRSTVKDYTIDLSNVSAGFYYIIYESGKIEKLVIQH